MTPTSAPDPIVQRQPLLTVAALCAVILAVIGPVALSMRAPSAQTNRPHPEKTLMINNRPLTVELVSTTQDFEQGLSGRPSMAPDHGMLFQLENAGRYSFWMSRMRFPLDILWIRDGKVVEIAHRLPAPKGDEPPAVYRPQEPANRVLEINAGQSERYGLTIGSTIPDLP